MSHKQIHSQSRIRRERELIGEHLTIDQIATMLKEDVAYEKAGHPGRHDRRTGHPIEHRRQTKHRGRG